MTWLTKTSPYYPYLLVFFFVFHGIVENYDLVPATHAVLLLLKYLLVASLLIALSWLSLKHIQKACFFAFMLLLYEFFFGNVYDLLKENFPASFIWNYRFLLPLSLIILILFF